MAGVMTITLQAVTEDVQSPIQVADSILQSDLENQGRACWRDLFLHVHTAEELKSWETTIPAYCTCRSFYQMFVEKTPPTFTTGGALNFEWKYNLKSAVNRKLGHHNLDLKTAEAFWNAR